MKSSEQRIEHILRRMLADRATDAPADAISWAKNLYRTRPAEQPKGVLQRIMALVTADIAPGQVVFGERSAASGQARQVLFEAGDNAVDLRITPANGKFDIRGQILGDGFENAEISLSGDSDMSAKADENAAFSITRVPAGDYGVAVRGAAAEIVIEQITLK